MTTTFHKTQGWKGWFTGTVS